MDKKEFFGKYAIDEEAFDKLGVSWGELEDIYADYSDRIPVYEDTARYLADLMNKEKSIHSIKYRVKDKEHLIEKIIRKSIENPGFIETYKDYGKSVKDLIGMRALHLFKENWIEIHNFLSENWEFYTTPRANYKKGDPQRLLDMYAAVGCELNEHRNGYRSIHYHLLIKPGRQEMVAEVQVRTLFEEAWSEIDHYVRYSSIREADHSEQAEPYLGVLNNITSNADSLASFINNSELLSKSGGDRYPDILDGDTPESVRNGVRISEQMHIREIYNKVRNG